MKTAKNRRIVRLGPFNGGLNWRDSWTDVAENELVWCMNIDIDTNGKLQSRPPIFHSTNAEWGTNLTYVNGVMTPTNMLWIMSTAGDDRVQVRVRSTALSQGNWVDALSGTGVGWKNATSGVFYKKYMYFALKTATATVGKIAKVLLDDIDDAASAATAVWTLINGPSPISGDLKTMCIHNDRLFAMDTGNVNRVYYSKPTDFNVWADPDGGQFDVGESNDPIVKIVALNNRLYIFKNQSIWTLDYTSDPVDDGTLQLITASVGAQDAIAYKSRIFGVSRSGVFELVGGQIYWLSDKLGLRENFNRDFVTPDATVTTYLKGSNNVKSITACDDKLYVVGWEVITNFSPTFNTVKPILVLNLENGAWTTYGLDRVEIGETTDCIAVAPIIANEYDGTVHVRPNTTRAAVVISTRDGRTDRDRIGVNGPPFASFATGALDFNKNVFSKRLFRAFLRMQNFYWDDNNNVFTVRYRFYNTFYETLGNSRTLSLNIDGQPTERDHIYEGVWHSIRARFRHFRLEVELNSIETTNSVTTDIKAFHWEIPYTEIEIDDRSMTSDHKPSSTFAPG